MWISSMFGPFQTEVWIIVMRSVRLVLVLLLLPASQQHDHNNQIFIFIVRESSFSGHESLLWLRPGFLHHVPAGGCGTISGDQWNVDCRSTKNRVADRLVMNHPIRWSAFDFSPHGNLLCVCVCARISHVCMFLLLLCSWKYRFVQTYGIYAYLSIIFVVQIAVFWCTPYLDKPTYHV